MVEACSILGISATGLHARQVQCGVRVAVAEADLHNYLALMQMRARRARALRPLISMHVGYLRHGLNCGLRHELENERPERPVSAAFPIIFSAGRRPACRRTWCSRVTRPHFSACRRRPLSPPRPGARTTPRTTLSPITMLNNPTSNQGA